jgi:seryl-tRNA synthetase
MKTLVKIIPIVLLVACGSGGKKSADVKELIERRDSLQTAQLKVEKEINNLNLQIAELDTTNTTDELKLIKKIALQRNKVVNMSKKLKALENDLASLSKERSLVPVSVKTSSLNPLTITLLYMEMLNRITMP